MSPRPVMLPSLSAAMDGGFTAIHDVSRAMSAVGAADDYRLIGGVSVMLHVQRLGLDLPLRATGDADFGVPPHFGPSDFQGTAGSHPLIHVSEQAESSSNGTGLVTEAMAPLLLTVTQAAAALGIGRSTMYTLMYRGDIRPVHIGRSIRIHTQDLEQFVAGLPRDTL